MKHNTTIGKYKDFFLNDVFIGDTIAFMETKYRSLMEGVVVSISEKTVLISHKELSNRNIKSETRQFHSQTINKIT